MEVIDRCAVDNGGCDHNCRQSHTGNDVIGQRLAHGRRQRPITASGSGDRRVGDEEADEFDERRGADEAALEDRSQQLDVVFTRSTESTVVPSLTVRFELPNSNMTIPHFVQ